jgi:hypothetical protein
MSLARLPWHMLKCPSRCQLFHCQFNYDHYFLAENDKETHEMECALVKISDGEWDVK